jgi:hypothetical protein
MGKIAMVLANIIFYTKGRRKANAFRRSALPHWVEYVIERIRFSAGRAVGMAASIRGILKMGQKERTSGAGGMVKRKQTKQAKASASPTSIVKAGSQLHAVDCASKVEAVVLRAAPETKHKTKIQDRFWNLAFKDQAGNSRLAMSAKSLRNSRALRATIVAIGMVIPSLCLGDASVVIFYVFSCVCLVLGDFAKSGLRQRPFAAQPQQVFVALKLNDAPGEAETPDEAHDSTSSRCADSSIESGPPTGDFPRSADGSTEHELSADTENLECPSDVIHYEARTGTYQAEPQRSGVGCDVSCPMQAADETAIPTTNLVTEKTLALMPASSETPAEDKTTTIPAKDLVDGKTAAPVLDTRLSWVDLEDASNVEGWRVTQPKFPSGSLCAAAMPTSLRTTHLDDGCDVAQLDVRGVASYFPQGKTWWADMDSSDDEGFSDWLERDQDGKPKKWNRS